MKKTVVLRVSDSFYNKIKNGYKSISLNGKNISFTDYTNYLSILIDDDIKKINEFIKKKNKILDIEIEKIRW